MKDKLEPNMYVRTNEGKITKLIEIDKDGFKRFDEFVDFTNYEIIKASYNIIDLIEVGDYVNGSKVVNVSIITNEKWIWVEETEDSNNKYGDDYVGYNNEQIKSIVTKEQFESIEYSLEG